MPSASLRKKTRAHAGSILFSVHWRNQAGAFLGLADDFLLFLRFRRLDSGFAGQRHLHNFLSTWLFGRFLGPLYSEQRLARLPAQHTGDALAELSEHRLDVRRSVDHLESVLLSQLVEARQQRGLVLAEAVVHVFARVKVHAG